jgi:hypothetical protein
MKKIFLCLGMISFSFLICACNNKDNDIVVEELEKPSGIINESEEENIETTNGFKNVKFGEFDLYVPYIKQSQKIGGVVYLDDDIEDNQFSYLDFYAKYNKPDGCNIATLRANSMSYYHIGTPPFQEKQEEYNQTEHVSEAFTTYMDEADKKIDNTKPYNKYYDTYDVQGISFCLYEDFYETYPQITCSIYGINSDVLEKYLGDENKYSAYDYEEMKNELKQNDYSECDMICNKKIEKSGVYYIDYNEINKKNDYKQFLIKVEFSEYIDNYSYDICGMYKYNIEDFEKFRIWKSYNKDWILGE